MWLGQLAHQHQGDLHSLISMLRDVSDRDLPTFFDHQRDPEACRMAAFVPRERNAFMVHWRERVLGDPGSIVRTIVDGDQIVGYVSSYPRDGQRLIAYWIGRAHWGRGLASAAVAEFLRGPEFGRPVFAEVASTNLGSLRVLKKCGFEPVGERPAGEDGVVELLLRLSAREVPRVRAATAPDTEVIAEIYNHYIRNTVVTFEETPISGEEIARRIEVVEAASLPWLVAEVGGQVRGYAYAGRWSPRSGYRHSAETAVYLDRAFPRRGLGTALYTELFALLRDRGIHAIISGIALPNEPSVALHEKFQMQKVAHFKAVGFKMGRWIDVGYWERILD